MHEESLKQIVNKFTVYGAVQAIVPFGSGHINDTYKVEMTDKNQKDYVLQRINHLVFKDVDALMQNMALVTQHIERRNEINRERGLPYFPTNLKLISTKLGAYYHRDEHHNYWRMMYFVSGAQSHDVVNTVKQAREGGRSFGLFHSFLLDLEPNQVQEILPNFHHVGHRLELLNKAIKLNSHQRLGEVKKEVLLIHERQESMKNVLRKGKEGRILKRLIHNDTKFNNILLNEKDEALCVIDLDTVMPGYLAYDFGDAIRTIINTAAEDEENLDHIQLNISLFSAYVQGYFEVLGQYLTEDEIESLLEGVLLLPYLQAVRFLTDYLEGDHYFKTQHPAHNLRRARAQLELLLKLEAAQEELQQIIKNQKNLSRFK